MPQPGEKDIKVGTGKANQNSVDANSFTNDLAKGVGGLLGLKAHLEDPQGAHEATTISTTTSFGLYDADDVQGDLDELSSLIPPRPATVGNLLTNFNTVSPISGIPDWGVLKLNDAGLIARGDVTSPDPNLPNNDADVYPYYNDIPLVASTEPPFSQPAPGNDPATDPTFNLDPAGTGDPTYLGGGVGLCHQGGFTRPQVAASPIIETMRIFPTAGGAFQPVVVSGVVYPADRGVLALFHWPAGGTVGDFLAQPLTNRVVAAIRLGQGLLDVCDGAPGGIFSEGDPDWFAYPGRATGQYQLRELHTGLIQGSGAPLPPPFNVADPGAGQVRLGTDPNAGVPVVAGGIPILGGTTAATGGGNDNNFFRYRLPYLDDYSDTTGLEVTPAAERFRYFDKPAVADNFLIDLTQAGDYPNLSKRYWEFQLGRYRHLFQFLQNAGDPIDQGAWILIHFQREQDFEAFARDGVMPDDATDGYSLWSSGLLDYLNPESTDNLAEPALPNATSPGYHVLRAAVYEDVVDFGLVLASGIGYTYTVTRDEVVAVSGIKYFVPGTLGSKWTITDLNINLTGEFWEDNYRLGNANPSPAELTPGLDHQNPLHLYFGAHVAEPGGINAPTATSSFSGTVEGTRGQRIEFRYDELDHLSGHGPFTLANGPLPTDTADLLLVPGDPMTFNGDTMLPHFHESARIRGFFRPPLGYQGPTDAARPYLFPLPGGATVLFHTTSQNPTDTTGDYGNFQTGGAGTPARAALEVALKDVEERFLDEVYRWSLDDVFVAGAFDPTWDGVRGNLAGPGLPFGAAGALDLPVRIGGNPAYSAISFLQNDHHTKDLGTALDVALEAQVVGMPDRNPPASDGVIAPVDSRGLLIYPVTDYTAGFRPSFPAGDITSTQFDYSIIADPQREYLRNFDIGFSRDAAPLVATTVGTTRFRLRIHGLERSDYAYAAPGPGSTEIAFLIKVPGLTTWMDLGRSDGAGPSKQDPLLDGAGCQVVDPQTLDAVDPQFGHVYSDVLVDVGPAASFFVNSDGEIPVLVRVILKSGSTLDWKQTGPDTTVDNLRGLLGIEILRPE